MWSPGMAQGSRGWFCTVAPELCLGSEFIWLFASPRSTFCSIIAQLTEETQPLFETTLKSKAVSEDSDVRFTCIVTGYPEPEVTWYKDDTELDRYCGLPKYEITHQGNRHTLQLYRCREEDAAIYQASARNTKGIVSCSGVLEVGTMTEYKIHQRWFAKLKRKAAAKMREIEQSWKHGKEAVGEADVLRKLSPDRFQRKRRLSGGQAPGPPAPAREAEEGSRTWQEGDTESAQHPDLGLITSFAPEEMPTNGEAAPENGEDGEHGLLTYICEAMELRPHRAPKKESRAKKKKKEEESKQSVRKPELEKAVGSHRSSESNTPSSNKPDARATQGPTDVGQGHSQPRGRASRGPGPSRVDNTGKPASAMGTNDKAQDSSAPGPTQEVYFSLKDMYMESTRAARPQGEEGSQTPSVRVSGENLSGQLSIEAGGERVPAAPGQSLPSLAPQPTRPVNRKRFAPPKPRAEPTADSKPVSPLSQTPEHGAQSLGKAPAQGSAQVPTPPARRRHSTRDSPLQGRAVHRTPGEVPESQATTTAATLAGGSSGVTSIGGGGTSRSHDVIEPMDTDTQAGGPSSADQRAGGEQDQQLRGEMQVEGRPWADGAQRSQRTQAEGEMQVEVVTQESARPQSVESSQRGVVTQAERTQAGEKTQEGTQMREAKGTQSGGSAAAATTGQLEPPSVTSLSPPAAAPQLPSPEGPRPPQITGGFAQTPAGSRVPEEPGFLLRPEEAAVPAPETHKETLTLPAQPPPGGSLEQKGGERGFPCPTEAQPGGMLCVDLGGCPAAGPSQEGPSVPSPPGMGPTSSPREGLPSTLTAQHRGTAAIQPSADQALPSSAPTLHLGPGPPSQGHPSETLGASSEGACAKTPPGEGGTSGPRSCDPGLIDSLKNYLLLLLKLSSAQTSGAGAEAQEGTAAGGLAAPSTLAPTVEVAGLSPRTSRRILERVENDHLVQSAQTLLLSPCTSRRLTGLLDREVQAGQRALAAAQGSRGPGPSPLTVPAIVVGEEEGTRLASEGPSEGEGELSPEGPGGPLGQAASGQGLLSAGGGAQEPFQEDEVPGEALTDLPAATPEELALGARRKRFLPKVRAAGDGEAAKPEERESPTVSPRGSRKSLAPGSPGTPGRERRSPTQGRRAAMLEVPRAEEEPALGSGPKASGADTELGPDEGRQESLAKPRKAQDQLKAPQVIRKIRVEQFPDASGSLKLWCQFFNILSDSVLTWAKDQRPVGEVVPGDEGPAALGHSCKPSPVDCGVYPMHYPERARSRPSTDFCLSPRGGGQQPREIEMTPMVFAKGLADSGCWGDKLFGRLVSEELRGHGRGCGLRKASQAKVIYGLDPLFESGRTCIIKVSSLLVFGPSSETSLLGRNYDVTIQGCKIQNMSREYCKIFAAEARAAPGFGEVPEIIPLYLIYRPANSIPYATLEEDLGKPLESYCSREWGCAGPPAASGVSEAVQKCQAFQHWLYQWTNGSFLVTDLAGVDWKMTDVQIATKLRGYQGLKESCCPALLDQFPQRKGAPSSKATLQASEAAAAQLLGEPPAQEGGSKAQGMR
uniref:non-specific serine/threonine protein kinase n=1 Tax=Oryctolagus cuniculus TaxID=9986 RepID=G1SQ37_RABIT